MKKVMITIFLILITTGCGTSDYSTNLFYMDTLINVKVYDVNKEEAEEAFKIVEDLYEEYELIASKYNENSELYKINNNEIDLVSDELLELINIGEEWYDKSSGLLNINMGSVTETWTNFRNGLIEFPTEFNYNTDMSNIKIEESKIIYNENLNIDLGSITKGVVTQKAATLLKEHGIKYFLINAGGNVYTADSTKGYYSIGIKSPISSESFMIIEDENIALATSGGYERFYEYEGVKYHHIIDPKTNLPANHMKSVTVIGKDAGLCDILSTVLFLMPIEEGLEFIKDYEVSAVFFTNDDEIIKSENFKYE